MMEASTEVTEEHETPSQGFDAVPPIERMPPELLHETFSYLTALELERLRSYDDEARPLPLPCGIILARVCTRWREIVCHDKALWTSIPLYFRPELQWTEKALQLSDPLPIDIFVHDVKSWRNVLPALDQLARARTISLYGIHLTPLSKADLPDMLPPDVLSGDAPQLKELNLTNVVMRANWTHSFPVLTEFEARNSLLWTTPKEMHAALSLMPQLRHLSLGQNDCLDFRWFDLPENVLHLEHLSSLSLEGDADDMADFLSCVSCPSGASLEIIIVNSPPNEKLGFALAAHFAPLSAVSGQLPVMHATATDSSLDIHIEYANLNPAYTFPDYIAIYIEYDDPDMEGYYVCFMIEHLLPSLPGHGGASALLLSRAEDCGDIIAREWLDPFLKLTGVQKLSVAGRAVYDLADRWSKERCDSSALSCPGIEALQIIQADFKESFTHPRRLSSGVGSPIETVFGAIEAELKFRRDCGHRISLTIKTSAITDEMVEKLSEVVDVCVCVDNDRSTDLEESVDSDCEPDEDDVPVRVEAAYPTFT